MLKWITRKSPGLTSFDTTFPDDGDEPAASALVEFWTKVLDEVERAHPKGGWEVLVAYAVLQCGDILVYPRMYEGDESEDPRKVDVMAHSKAWATAFGDLPEVDDPADERPFLVAFKTLQKAQARVLKAAILDPAVLPRFKALKARPKFAVFYVPELEIVTPATMIFLWGNRPPKGIPHGSAKEVFRYLLEKASIWADDCMVFEGERLTSVTFFGGNFNNKYVDLLEGVPDLDALCAALRTLKLEHTRITPAGIERLRKIVPAVEVRVVDSYDDEDE